MTHHTPHKPVRRHRQTGRPRGISKVLCGVCARNPVSHWYKPLCKACYERWIS